MCLYYLIKYSIYIYIYIYIYINAYYLTKHLPSLPSFFIYNKVPKIKLKKIKNTDNYHRAFCYNIIQEEFLALLQQRHVQGRLLNTVTTTRQT